MALVQVEIRPLEGQAGVAVVTLDDPDRRNALSEGMVGEIVEIFDRLESDPGVGAVVVTGAPPAFCAGANLSNLDRSGAAARQGQGGGPAPAGDGGQGRSMRSIYEGFLRVGRSSLPTIAAVNGAAVGAGMNLALVCDLRIAGRSARFDTRFLDLGLHPGGGHTWMLHQLVGPQTARAMVLFGQILDGEAAAARGLAWDCVADEELLDTAVAVAARAASAPPELARRAKDTLGRMGAVDEHERAVDVELEAQLWSMSQPFFAERLAAVQRRVSSRSRS
ncbi:MAG TPA: enoyl-CoA hydratase [Acidimicrobiales bacterium]|nr:enoyl-CoA hydratase [Acidimicrobiales bacterium]